MPSKYLQYLQDNPQNLWFKRKVYGWGWIPVKWQGWAVIAGFIIVLFLITYSQDLTAPLQKIIFTFFLPIVVLTALLIYVCYVKGEEPKWQWGGDLKKYN